MLLRIKPLNAKTISRFWNHTAKDVRKDIQYNEGRGAVGIVNDELKTRLEEERQQRLQRAKERKSK